MSFASFCELVHSQRLKAGFYLKQSLLNSVGGGCFHWNPKYCLRWGSRTCIMVVVDKIFLFRKNWSLNHTGHCNSHSWFFSPFQIWAGPLSGNRLVVAFWNRCSSATMITVEWNVLGLQSSISVSVRDLWQVLTSSFYFC